MSSTPLVSVIIPTYNCAPYIVEAIESVLAQTYRNLEIIVVDDGSTDQTQAVLAPYRGRITYLYQENRGLSAARNLAIHHASGALVAFLDSDDVWYPGKLALQVQALQQYSEAGLSFTDYQLFDESAVIEQSGFDARVQRWVNQQKGATTRLVFGWIYRELLLQGNYMHVSSIIVTRDALEQVGLFDEAFKVAQDYDLWLRIAQRFPVVCINRILCGYRYRPDSLSGPAQARPIRWSHEILQVLEKHLRHNWIPHELEGLVKDYLSRLCWGVGWSYFHLNRFKEARSLFFHGARYRPLHLQHWLFLGAALFPLPIIEGIRCIKRRAFPHKRAYARSKE